MHCPFCRNPDSRVIDSRSTDDGAAIRRRRSCPECGRRFTTQETVLLMVAKRSGVTEPFSREKIIAGVRRACQGRPVTEDALAQLGQRVEEAVRATGNAEMRSHEVGLAILGPLRELDEVAYLQIRLRLPGVRVDRRLREGNRISSRRLSAAGNTCPLSLCCTSNPGDGPVRPEKGEVMTETVSGQARRGRGGRKGLKMERIFTRPGIHPYDEVRVGAPRRRHDQLAGRVGQLRAARRRVPRLVVGQRDQHRHLEVLPRRGRHHAARVEPEAAGRPRRRRLHRDGPRAGLLRDRRGRRDLRPRAEARPDPPGVQLQLAGVVQRRHGLAAAGLGLLHPVGGRHDGVDPRLVQGRGRDLQGGSGSGVNLSRIRSSKELLSSGGTASGPVSFMRGADASAGTIKSGGATRRAAKMVVLDVDHPDVEEFIETKAREEDKIRALRDAGYRHGPRRQGHRERSVPERQQLGARLG